MLCVPCLLMQNPPESGASKRVGPSAWTGAMATAEQIREAFVSSPVSGKVEIPTTWPSWGLVGRATYLYYMSDKWQAPGDFRIYYHETTSYCWEPGVRTTGGRVRPIERPPNCRVAILAPAIGWQVIGNHGQELIARCAWGDLWCGYEIQGKTYLMVVDMYHHKLTALFEGPKLAIRPEGIVG